MRTLFRCASGWRFGKLVLAGALSLAVAACNPFTPTYTYRYRITVEVDTPQGLRTGSSVWETSAWQGSGIPDSAIRSRVRGEAVAVDLPGGTLFALLRGQNMSMDYAAAAVENHFAKHPAATVPTMNDWQQQIQSIVKAKPAAQLYPDNYPLLVRFRDINDPASVKKVEPFDLAASFGPGVRLRRIVVQVTDDRVTKGIEERLPWLPSQRGMLLEVPTDTPMNAGPFPSLLTEGDFKRSS